MIFLYIYLASAIVVYTAYLITPNVVIGVDTGDYDQLNSMALAPAINTIIGSVALIALCIAGLLILACIPGEIVNKLIDTIKGTSNE